MNNFSKMMILGKSGETTNKNDQDMRNTGNDPHNKQGDRMTSEMLGRTPYNYNDNGRYGLVQGYSFDGEKVCEMETKN